MKSVKLFSFSSIFFLIFISCSPKDLIKETSLKNSYKENFLIGTALNIGQINETVSVKEKQLLLREFNSITPENIMKSMFIHPAKDTFYFDMADKFVAFGEKNNMHIQGHTLIWHSQLAPWFYQIKDSLEMVEVMTNHINTIVGKYKGKINAWDVVNEALNDDGTMRKSVFLDALGEDFMTLAFKLAEKADPNVELYYNDYSMTNPQKREGAIRMIKRMQANGAKVDGIGMQAHMGLNGPTIEEFEKSIIAYSALGIKVAFTEVDVNVLPNPWDFQGADVSVKFEERPGTNPYVNGLPDSIQTKLTKRYKDVFELLLKHQEKISRVTLWGAHDGQSWKNNWPVQGRTDYPLLFDRNFDPKPAYNAVMALKEEK